MPQMLQALGALLDQVPGSREVLLHLAALEQLLPIYGWVALEQMPLAVLSRVRVQLAGLPVRADDRPLQALLARLADVQERRKQPRAVSTTALICARSLEEEPVVSDATLSDFMRASLGVARLSKY
jgi:hypothetical protein